MKKWIKIIIAVVIFVVFARAILVLSGMETAAGLTKPSIAVMDISGQIFESTSAIETLKKLKNNPLVEGVIIRVDSPGGAVAPSMEIYDYILNLGKPVYAAMGSVAASGGYLISLGADSIYAEPSTITGSIGVIMNLVNTQELMDKIGVKSVVLKSGAYKDAGSPAREMTEQDKKVLNDVLMDMYYQFTDIVIQRRGMAKEKVMALADGRIYTGRMAQKEISRLLQYMKCLQKKQCLKNLQKPVQNQSLAKYFLLKQAFSIWRKYINVCQNKIIIPEWYIWSGGRCGV